MLSECITLDGLTGSGKSIVGLLLAEAMQAYYIETSVLYQAATWAVGDANVIAKDTELVNYALEDMELKLVEREPRPIEDLGLLADMFCNWGSIKVKLYDLLVNNEVVEREKLEEQQESRGTRWVMAWYDNLFKTLVNSLEVRHILEAKAQKLAQTYRIVAGGDKIGPSFILNANFKYILTAPDTLRNIRIVRTGRSVGAIWDRSDILPEVRQRDSEYREQYERFNMPYISEECFHEQSEEPRIHPVRDEYWSAMLHPSTDTRPFVVNTVSLSSYKVAKLIKPDLPIKFHRGDLHNEVML
jgi:cytidylate kinase